MRNNFGGHFGSLWAALGAPLGDLGTLWEHFGVTLGGLGYSKGTLRISLCRSVAFHENRSKCGSVARKQTFWNTNRISEIRRILSQNCEPDPPFLTHRGPG